LVSTFDLKDIFKNDFCELISKKYNFKKNDSAEIHKDLEETFKDFIILILSENNSYTIEERNKLYNEAIFNLQQTSKLLQGMPHPASSMSYKLLKMAETLKKVTFGSKKEKTKANRFIEKNLVRKFIVFWNKYNDNKFLSKEDKINYLICECFMDCSQEVHRNFPDIEWFKDCEIDFVESLFENI
tara:strand:+ start:165 stop:719 length:555 start_codon:yes stop_codon:yes gene_type:complete